MAIRVSLKNYNAGRWRFVRYITLCYILLYPLLIGALFKESEFVSFCFFSVFFIKLADPGGLYTLRISMYFAAAIILTLECVLAGLFRGSPVVSVMLIFLWSFCSGLMNSFGGRGTRISSIATVSFAIFLLSPAIKSGVFINSLLVLSAFAWIMIPELAGLIKNPYSPLLKGTADYIRAISPVDSFFSGRKPDDILRVKNNAFLIVRDLKSRYSIKVARMHKILITGESIYKLQSEISEKISLMNDSGNKVFSELVSEKINLLHYELAHCIESPVSDEIMEKYFFECSGAMEIVLTFKHQITANRELNQKAELVKLADYIVQYIELLRDAGETAGGSDIRSFVKGVRDKRDSSAGTGTFGRVREQLTFRSDIFRHSLRLATAMAAATAAVMYLKPPFGYWIPVSTAIILKPDSGSSALRAAERIGGTVIGCVIVLLLSFIHLQRGALFFTAMLSAFIALNSRARSYIVYAVFWTVTVVMLLDFNHAGDMMVALERIVYNMTGGALALVSVYFLFTGKKGIAVKT